MATEALSILTYLEPTSGAGLALNMAYLNLQRFRYRRKIRDIARDAGYRICDQMDPKLLKQAFATGDFKTLGRLCRLEDNDDINLEVLDIDVGPDFGVNDFESGEKSWHEREFNALFSHHIDRVTSITLAIWCAIVLFLGVLLQVAPEAQPFFMQYFSVLENKPLQLIMAGLSMAIPMTLIYRGGEITRALVRKVRKIYDTAGQMIAAEAASLDVPMTTQATNPQTEDH